MTQDAAHGDSPCEKAPSAQCDRCRGFSVAAILAAIVFAMIFPGDAPLNVDESALIAFAAAANTRHGLVEQGLTGSVSFCYGPIPAQIYQVLLMFTREIPWLVVLHVALFLGTMAAALWSIGNTLGLKRFGFIAFTLATPWAWFYARDLWDNPFCIPVSCVAMAGYARWLMRVDRPAEGEAKSPRLPAIAWSASVVLMPIIHAVGAPTSLAIMGHAIFLRWKALRWSLPWIALGIVLGGCTSWPYLQIATKQLMQRVELRIAGYPRASTRGMGRPAAARAGRLVSASYALRAADGLSADHAYFDPPRDLGLRRWLDSLYWIGSLAHVWIAIGAIIALRMLSANAVRSSQSSHAAAERSAASDPLPKHRSELNPCASLFLVAILSIALLALEFFLAHTGQAQQYYSGAFGPAAILCWVGVERLWRWTTTRWLLVVLPGAAIVALTILISIAIHRMGGAPHPYGPTISNRLTLARELAIRRPDKIYCNNRELNEWPDLLPLAFWPKINAPKRAPVALIAHRRAFPGDYWLVIQYRDPPDDSFVPIQFQRP